MAHTTHVGSESVDLVHACHCRLRVGVLTQVEQPELIGLGERPRGQLEVHTAYEVTVPFQRAHEMSPYETTGSGHEYSLHGSPHISEK